MIRTLAAVVAAGSIAWAPMTAQQTEPPVDVCVRPTCTWVTMSGEDADRVLFELKRIPELREETSALRELVSLQDQTIRTASVTLALRTAERDDARATVASGPTLTWVVVVGAIAFVVGAVAGGYLVGVARN